MKEELADKLYSDDMSGFDYYPKRKDKTRKERILDKPWRIEQLEAFHCSHCHSLVPINAEMGTKHRNHCNTCLWSQHVDLEKAGDRKSSCHAGMKPIGLTFKQAGVDKYGKIRQGELMIIHQCANEDCGKISINRIASDDNPNVLLWVYEGSRMMDEQLKADIAQKGIRLLGKIDESQIRCQLFGRQR